MKKIKNIEFASVEIDFYCIVDPTLYDIGALTLTCEDRNFILDVVRTDIYDNNNHSTFNCTLAVDIDTFEPGEEYNYLLTESDISNPSLKATLYIGGDFMVEPESVNLGVILRGHTTKMIEVENE